MTHQPPVPAANQSPYPLQEPPHSHDDGPPPGAPVARTPDDDAPALSRGLIGALTMVGVTALAAAGAWAFSTRAKPRAAKRKTRRAKR